MKNKNISILILYTGGTIGMVADPDIHSLKPLDFKHVRKEIPELNKFPYNLVWKSLDPVVDSSDIHPANWIRMAETIFENYNSFDGFVILHGTDTMAYSASALSFMLENLGKPVIFTGSQLPIGLVRTDGRDNLIAAIEVAASRENNRVTVSEVCIFFENKLFRGNRTTKYSAENFNAYISPNYPILAESGVHLKFYKEYIAPPPEGKSLVLHKNLDQAAGLLKIFPGITKEWVQSLFSIQNLKAVVMETFGSGNGPTDPWFIDCIARFIERGGVVLNVTQCLAGRVDQGKYETSLGLRKVGVISGSDITTEAAVTKLMHLLGQQIHGKNLNFALRNAISGEIS